MWFLQNPRGLTSGLTMPTERKAGEMFINEVDEKVFIKKTDLSSFELNTKSVFDAHVLSALNTSHIVDDVTTGGSGSVLSAEQGKVLKGLIDNLNTLVTSNDVSLDTLQEIVDFIKLNRSDLDALTIASIAGLQAALDAKANAADVSVLPTYTVTNALTQRSFDANATTIDQLADVVATLAADINGGLIWPQWPAGNDGADWATYDDTALTALVNTKADQATTYTKTEVDGLVWGGWAVTVLNTFTQLGTIVSGSYGRYAAGQAGTLAEVNVTYLDTAPTGSNATVEVKKNGTSLGTVTVTAGTSTGEQTTFSDTVIAKHDIIEFVVTAGSSVAGSGISINTIVS